MAAPILAPSASARRHGRLAMLALALVLFAAVFALRLSDGNAADAESVLFVVPISILALVYGLRGGLAAAVTACLLVLAWGAHRHGVPLDADGFVNRCIAFLVLGGLLGVFVDNRRHMEVELLRYADAQHEAELQIAENAKWLETEVARRTRELDEARAEMLQRLVVAAEYHDEETSQHTERVGAAAAEIAARMGLSAEQVKLLRQAAPLHDVGKLAIPDRILLKRGKLNEREFEVMKTHTALGARLLSGSSSAVLQMAAVIAESHHERWDGAGYPQGLAGEAIPLVGRIVAVADVFDALTHGRPYKAAWPVERAIVEVQSEAGHMFDPNVVAVFLTMHEDAVASMRRQAVRASAQRTPSRALSKAAGSAPAPMR